MSYNKKTWTNRESEYPNRYRMHSTNGNIADVSIIPYEGSVTVEGDKFNAATMNNMEQRIANGFTEASSALSSAVNTLNQSITQERTRATGEENLLWHDVHELQDNLSDEVTRATGAEQTLTTNLSNEVTRATGIEQGLRTDVTALQGRMINAEDDLGTLTSRISSLETTIELESTRAQEAEETLDGKIDDETSRATNAETIISGNLNDEITRATTAETALSNSISAETTRATNSENTLSDNILAETTRATGVETQLQTDLTAEVTRATQAEIDLHNYVEQKVSTAYKAAGSVYFADLPAPTASRLGYVYNIKDDFVTTEQFVEGAGKAYGAGADVVITQVEIGTSIIYMYDVAMDFIDLSDYVQKTDYATNSKAGIVKPDGTTITIDANGMISSVGGGQGSAEMAEKMIAPIEADATESTHVYAIGSRLILNELLYEVIDDIAIGDALVAYEDDPTNANIKLSDDVTTMIKNKTITIDQTVTQGSANAVSGGAVYTYIDTMITQAISASY